MDDEKLVKTRDIAKLLSFHQRTILVFANLSRENPLPSIRVGGQLRYRVSEVMAWVERGGMSAPARTDTAVQVEKPRKAKQGKRRKGEPDLSLIGVMAR